jgi:hypothetical protein
LREKRILVLYDVPLVRTDVSEEHMASTVSVTRIGGLGMSAVTSNRSTRRLLVTANVVPSSSILVALMIKSIYSSETSILTRATSQKATSSWTPP